jgi:Superinfection immunity protein
MNALAHSYLFWIALTLGLLGLYILPSVIAAIHGVEGLGWIIVINLLPTGVGWLAALIGALMLPRRETAVLQTYRAEGGMYSECADSSSRDRQTIL